MSSTFKKLASLFSKKSNPSSRSDTQSDSDDDTLSVFSQSLLNSNSSLKRKHLVLDLDETLINAQTKKDSAHKHKAEFMYRGTKMTYYVAVRPGLVEFLEEMQKYYVLHIYTCSDLAYADAILTKIDAKKYFAKIYSRVDCKKTLDRNLGKDLSVVGVDMSDVILVDDLERHIQDNKPNALKISGFYGGKTDGELKKIAKFLKKLVFCQDVRSVGDKYQLFLEGKQFVTESDLCAKENPVSPMKMQVDSFIEKQASEEEDDDELSLDLAHENPSPRSSLVEQSETIAVMA